MLLHPRAVGSKLKLVGGSTAPGREGAGGCQVRAPSCAAKGVAVWRALVAASGNLPRRFNCPGCSRTWLSCSRHGPVECFWLWDLGLGLVMPERLGAYGHGALEVRDAASMLQDEKSSLSERPELRNVNLRPRCSAFASCRLPAAGFLGRLACMEQKLRDTAADLERATQAQARRDLSQSCAALLKNWAT